MSLLEKCRGCGLFVRRDESVCPFCGAAIGGSPGVARALGGLAMGLSLAGCPAEEPVEGGGSTALTINDAQSAYGCGDPECDDSVSDEGTLDDSTSPGDSDGSTSTGSVESSGSTGSATDTDTDTGTHGSTDTDTDTDASTGGSSTSG